MSSNNINTLDIQQQELTPPQDKDRIEKRDTIPTERMEILAFPIDVSTVLKHLHRDMRDDWFEDALQHRDLFASQQALKDVLHEVLLEGNGRYSPSKRNVCDIPKKGL